MPQQPKYRQYRTIRDTMNATGLTFGEARSLRANALAKSTQGREMLQREERRRSLQRLSLPRARHDRDYGPTSPHAVVLQLTFHKSVRGALGWHTQIEKRGFTLTFKRKPTPRQIDNEIGKIYEDHMTENGPLGDSDIDTDWELYEVETIGYYTS